MDEAAVAAQFGDRLTFLARFDVQHTLVEGSPEQVGTASQETPYDDFTIDDNYVVGDVLWQS
jgi:hypothetical protein